MSENEKYPIREDWEDYYRTLEGIRRTGVVNMFGAAPVLRECFTNLSVDEANNILCNWITNYDKLNQKYGWQK